MILLSVIDDKSARAESDVWNISDVCFARGIRNIKVKNTTPASKNVGFRVFLTISIHVKPPARVTNISLFEKYLPKHTMIARNSEIGATRVTFSGSVKITNFTIASIPRPCE